MSNGIFSQYDAQDLNRLAAKGILEKLRNIRQKINVEFTARRLIWELIQNAKDNAATCNIEGNSNVSILLELSDNQLVFSHNNGYFTNENIRGLIRRYSSSEKDKTYDLSENLPSTTGRFGTGFMTTHLLSEEVLVKGTFQKGASSFCRFVLPIDRTGLNEKSIINSVESSFHLVEESIKISKEFDFSETNNFKTEFIYSINDSVKDLVNISISEIEAGFAYALINIPTIKKITIKKDGSTYEYGIHKTSEIEVNEKIISIIEVETNDNNLKHRFFATISDEDTRIIVPLSIKNNGYNIEELPKNLPRLFLDFPLIGTEDINIPFIINSPLFEPTDSRDGVSLTGGKDRDTSINSVTILKGFDLFKIFVDYVSSQLDWGQIFNLARFKNPKEKDWIDKNWFDNTLIKPILSYLINVPLVDLSDGLRVSIKNKDGSNNALFPSASKIEIREKIWDLSIELVPNLLPKKTDIHEWYEIIWDDCPPLTIESLTKGIQRRESLDKLSTDLKKPEDGAVEWLNKYYDLLNFEAKFIDEIALDKFKVIPNQNNLFKINSELCIDKKIDDELKNVLKILGEDIRDILIHKGINTKNNHSEIEGKIKHGNRDSPLVVDQINKFLKEKRGNSKQAISYLLALFSKDEKFPEHRYKMYDFSKALLGEEIPIKMEISFWDESIWEYADKVRINRLVTVVSECKSLIKLQNLIAKSTSEETIFWLQSFIDFLIAGKFEDKLNLKANPILPDQNGDFKIKDDLFLDSCNIDEGIKDIAFELGSNVRAELLEKSIVLELPENRVRSEQYIAEEISKLIKPILRDERARVEKKDVIRKLYLWMNKNRIVAERIFGYIYEKRFLLVSDDEIAANIEKAEILEEIIEETGLSAKDIKEKLIILLSNPQITEALKQFEKTGKSNGILYPEGCEEDIMVSLDLLDLTSEKSRISTSEEAKEIIFKILKENGFNVPTNLDINYTIVTGISKPDGTPIKIVVKSGRAGKIYFNPNEWLTLTEADTQLFVVTRGNIVRNVTLSDLEAYNDKFHMRFDTHTFAINSNLKAFANLFQYMPYTHFIFDTPESTTDYLEEFGLNQRNPSIGTLTADDKNLLH